MCPNSRANIYAHCPDCPQECNDTPTPLPENVGQMCSGQGGPYEGTEGAVPGCEYYRWRHNDFVKRHRGCKPPIPEPLSYYLEYGEKYCNKFSRETRQQLTPEGQIWLDKTRCALQQKIEDILEDYPEIEMHSERFRKSAFQTHSDAYVDSGLADLLFEDWKRIAFTVDGEEWKKWETWRQVLETGWKILPTPYVGTLAEDFGTIMRDATD